MKLIKCTLNNLCEYQLRGAVVIIQLILQNNLFLFSTLHRNLNNLYRLRFYNFCYAKIK